MVMKRLRHPRWSPDGKYLSFLSSRDSKTGSQVWLIDRRGGEGAKTNQY
jgi:Tol biopolymer transport system component